MLTLPAASDLMQNLVDAKTEADKEQALKEISKQCGERAVVIVSLMAQMIENLDARGEKK